MKVKKFKELINEYQEDMNITMSDNRDIIHIVNIGDTLILSVTKPIGYCNKCGEYVYPEEISVDYVGFCPTCDENLYDFEITKKEITKNEP